MTRGDGNCCYAWLVFVAAYVYVNALASETQGEEGVKLVLVWVMVGWLYHGVIGAIDDAEERLE